MIYIALSAKKSTQFKLFRFGSELIFFAIPAVKLQWKLVTGKGNTSLIMLLQKADQMIWPIQQRLFLEDATPRNLVIGKYIADDRLYANIFGDGGGCHLHVVGELLESSLVFVAQREVDWLDLQEVMARLELGCGEGYSGTAADPMSGDLPDAVRDVP